MKLEKIGNFICTLRKEKNLTQIDLSKLIHVSRQAISKWERGKSLPEIECLYSLSEIFEVSVNELLLGERYNEDNRKKIDEVSLNLYKENIVIKKKKFLLLVILMIILILFLGYYFINSYKKIRVYTVTGIGDKLEIAEGVFIRTNEKLYFNISGFYNKTGEEIKSVLIYYENDGEYKRMCQSGNDGYVTFKEIYGYNEFFEVGKIDEMIQNIYLKVIFNNDEEEIIKLDFNEYYVNGYFYQKVKPIILNDESLENNNNNKEIIYNEELMEKIENSFKEENGNYYSETKDLLFVYSREISMLLADDFDKENKLIKSSWRFHLDKDILTYYDYVNDYAFSVNGNEISCSYGECEDMENKLKFFWEQLNKVLK